jgi:hypothetical protein
MARELLPPEPRFIKLARLNHGPHRAIKNGDAVLQELFYTHIRGLYWIEHAFARRLP